MTNLAIAHARLRNARLIGEPLATAVDVVRWFGAVQSQDIPGALWALAQRLPPGATMDGLGSELDAGAFLRTHALRPTWHFLAPDELRWIEELTKRRVHLQNDGYLRRIGLADDASQRALDVIRTSLAGGRSLTQAELKDRFGAAGIDVSNPLATGFLRMHAELEAVTCNGPRRGAQQTFLLVDEHVPPTPPRDRDDALRDLIARYFTSHGPATVHDAGWWSGLTVTDIRRGISLAGDALTERTIDGAQSWAGRDGFEPAEVATSHVLLLSNYDEAVGSYADYSPVVDPAFAPPNWINDSVGPHVVLREGLVVGGWRRSVSPRRAELTVTMFTPFSAPDHAALEAELERYRAFLGIPVDVRVVEP